MGNHLGPLEKNIKKILTSNVIKILPHLSELLKLTHVISSKAVKFPQNSLSS